MLLEYTQLCLRRLVDRSSTPMYETTNTPRQLIHDVTRHFPIIDIFPTGTGSNDLSHDTPMDFGVSVEYHVNFGNKAGCCNDYEASALPLMPFYQLFIASPGGILLSVGPFFVDLR